MRKKKSASVKAIVYLHITDARHIIREEDMQNMKLGVEEEEKEWPDFPVSSDSFHTVEPDRNRKQE